MYSVWFVFTSNLPTATVQAPHPPSAHPNFVPVLPLCLRYCNSVILVSTDDDGIVSLLPFTKNNKFDASISDDDDVSDALKVLNIDTARSKLLRPLDIFSNTSLSQSSLSLSLSLYSEVLKVLNFFFCVWEQLKCGASRI